MSLILTPNGQPARTGGHLGPQPLSPDREDRVRQALKELDPLLDIRWFPNARVRRGSFVGRYALICRWPEIDKRWEMYHAGEIGEPFDIMGWFEGKDGEVHWHTGGDGLEAVDPLDAMNQALELLGECDNTRQSWKERLRKSAEHNRDLKAKRKADAIDETVQGMKYYRKFVRREPIVCLGDGLKDETRPEDGNGTPTQEE